MSGIKHLACIVGARPNFVKMAALLAALEPESSFRCTLIHTGQHYSPEMSANIFRDVGLRDPDIVLEVGGGSVTVQTANAMIALEPVLAGLRPDLVLLVGDVNSTLAGALVASRLRLKIAHVEAGLRSFDYEMPEEVNRVLTDRVSDILFVTEESGISNLRREGIPEDRVHLVGNVMIDTLQRSMPKADCSRVLHRLGLAPRKYAVATLHRPSNVDDPIVLNRLVLTLSRSSAILPVVFPVHPRTRAALEASPAVQPGADLRVVPPFGYLDFVHLLSRAAVVLTDSGGIQEETTALRVPCLTLRSNTERPSTVHQGTNELVGTREEIIIAGIRRALSGERRSPAMLPPLWDGRAGFRVAQVLRDILWAGANY